MGMHVAGPGAVAPVRASSGCHRASSDSADGGLKTEDRVEGVEKMMDEMAGHRSKAPSFLTAISITPFRYRDGSILDWDWMATRFDDEINDMT